MIFDGFGRPVKNLRISITQNCNLRCPYCHREGEDASHTNLRQMTSQEIIRLTKIATSIDIGRIKLTGGEPLIRKDILTIVAGIAVHSGLTDLSLTTNGTLLAPLAEDLHNAGLMRVNVTLPTLRPSIYQQLINGDLDTVLKGIEAAIAADLHPVKINMVALAGVNEHELPEMITYAQNVGALLQLIELEPLNLEKTCFERYHLPLEAVEADFQARSLNTQVRRDMQNRRIYHLPEGRVEVIRPFENTEFCSHCTRLRITSDGKLKPCLMVNNNLIDVLTPLRAGATDTELAAIFTETCRRREPFYKKHASPPSMEVGT
ncbi:MAG: GTP 3',8-cyclase MoaA [Candidatus Bathyarchaeota archaeon]|nr:MAG: GTP 3',8-cyclase MoaA [Candidatus Bathyarchaeota archaeon]